MDVGCLCFGFENIFTLLPFIRHWHSQYGNGVEGKEKIRDIYIVLYSNDDSEIFFIDLFIGVMSQTE